MSCRHAKLAASATFRLGSPVSCTQVVGMRLMPFINLRIMGLAHAAQVRCFPLGF